MKIKLAILSRYQGEVNRGAERVVADLAKRLSQEIEVKILSGAVADSWMEVRRGDYDLVMPVNGGWQAIKMSWGRWFGGYRVMIIGHSGLGRDDLLNVVVARPNVFVGLTQATLENWRMKMAKWLAPGVRLVQIHNGVNLDVFTGKGVKTDFGVPGPVILSVGALVPQKRHHLAIEAVAGLAQGSLVIVGTGPEKANLERLAKAKLAGRFRIMSAEFDQLPAIYRAADLFTLPSWDREAFGVVYLEAMASGLAVVAPDDASRREIVGLAGVLVDVVDQAKYTAGLTQALAKKWGELPRQQAAKFDWQLIGQQYLKLIKQLCR